MLNNQPMGFYSPATLVKDAQRRGVRFTGVDVQHSHWLCKVDADGSIRLGLRYVSGLREEVGQSIARARESTLEREVFRERGWGPASPKKSKTPLRCPKCGCDDASMLEVVRPGFFFCNTCSHDWDTEGARGAGGAGGSQRFGSVDDLVSRTGIRREELQMLAEIGAFASFGYERREALWQVEKAIRPAGELFEPESTVDSRESTVDSFAEVQRLEGEAGSPASGACPLPPMNAEERLVADYAGTHLTIGPHPCVDPSWPCEACCARRTWRVREAAAASASQAP